MHHKNIPIIIQKDPMLHSLLCLETALHVLGGTTTHHQECIQLYLQHLVFVRLLLLPAAIVPGGSNHLTNTRSHRYSCMCSWWWVEVPPETCRAVSRYNKLCNIASCWIYIRMYWNVHLNCILLYVIHKHKPSYKSLPSGRCQYKGIYIWHVEH